MLTITTFLFTLLNGVPLANTFWILPWIIFWSFVMILPVLLLTNFSVRTWREFFIATPLFVICFFGGLSLAIGPPLVQLQYMGECRTFETEVSSDLSAPTTVALRECRHKTNVYDEFGPWTIQQGRS